MERLGPRRDAQGGGEQRAGAARRRREGTAGPGPASVRPSNAPPSSSGRRAPLRVPGTRARGFPAGAGPAERLHLHKVPAPRPAGAAGRGVRCSEPRGEVRGGGGRPRSAQGDIRLPARRAHRVSEGTFLPPSGRGQPIEGAPLLCSSRPLHAARAPQPEPVLSGASPRLRGSPSLPQDAGERSPLCRTQVRASSLAVTLSQ